MTKYDIGASLLFLKNIIDVIGTKRVKTLTISQSFQIRDIEHFKMLLKDLQKATNDLTKLSNKGYVNDPNVNIPCVEWLLREYNLVTNKTLTRGVSVTVNTFYYNTLLLLLLSLITQMETWVVSTILLEPDLNTDLKVVKREVFRMIHPNIAKKLRKRGLSVVLNTFTGFDSEYELESSRFLTNELISIQLASNTNYYLKVPYINNDDDHLEARDLIVIPDNNSWGDSRMVDQCLKNIEYLIDLIRRMSFHKSDDFLLGFMDFLESSKYLELAFVGRDYKLFTSRKTPVVSHIKLSEKYCTEHRSDDSDIVNYLSGNSYSSTDLVKDSESLTANEHEKSLLILIEFIYNFSNTDEISARIRSRIKECSNKPLSRMNLTFDNFKINLTINRMLYIGIHESAADLSLLSDFNDFKESLDIVSRNFVTLKKPLTLDYAKSRVHIRDTILISPAKAKSLKAIGKIYGSEFHKIDIGEFRQNGMKQLLQSDRERFIEYAIKDSQITLKHMNQMEEFYLTTGRTGVPLTLSGVGKAYVLNEWSKVNYDGYQVSKDINIGNLASILTPKDARSIDLSRYIVSYITAYRGGRNESMMYGIDNFETGSSHLWYDYDLTSCYTTVMSLLGHPATARTTRLVKNDVLKMNDKDFMLNYVVLDVEFKFPNNTKYPSIPTRVDNDVDIYPLRGRSVITGPEYLVAKSMGCVMDVKDGCITPFDFYNKDEDNINSVNDTYLNGYLTPFRNVVKELQRKRREFPKDSFYNLMYKEIGNSIYGQIAMGLSNKKSFDIKTKSYTRIEGSALSNPILASYITGFTRALIGELLFNIEKLGGRVVSVTTDGFITDIDDLESRILNSKECKVACLIVYKSIRRMLTTFEGVDKYDDSGLEKRHSEGSGLLSWKTRGQLGRSENGISAATGFQKKYRNSDELYTEFYNIIEDDSHYKNVDFVQQGLRSATDVYKDGGHVIMKYTDKKFSLAFDNKRRVAANDSCLDDRHPFLLDSKPWDNVTEYGRIRVFNSAIKTPVFKKDSPIQSQSKAYKSYIETGVRGFIKACLASDPRYRYGIPMNYFRSYKSIIDFVYGHQLARQDVKLSRQSISNLKNRVTITRAVPRTPENESFVEYIKKHIETFDSDGFFRELTIDAIKARKALK